MLQSTTRYTLPVDRKGWTLEVTYPNYTAVIVGLLSTALSAYNNYSWNDLVIEVPNPTSFIITGGSMGNDSVSGTGFADGNGVGIDFGTPNPNGFGVIYIPPGPLNPIVRCIVDYLRVIAVGAAVFLVAGILAAAACAALPAVGCAAIGAIIGGIAYDIVQQYQQAAQADCQAGGG